MALVPATRSAGPCATACCPDGIWNGPCVSAMRPARSWPRSCPAGTPCRRPIRLSASWRRRHVSDERFRALIEARVTSPGAIAEAAKARKPAASLLGDHGKLMMIAADHPARGALRAGPDPLAMADRSELLNRLCLALSRRGVNGVLGTPD